MSESDSDKLIFILSQPRSGSTLLQKILGNHPLIYTRSEPWFMFPYAYALKNDGIYAEYDFNMYKRGIADFVNGLKDGQKEYNDEIREMCTKIYLKFLGKEQYFLDKTPRYYLIFDELQQIFPDGKFIIIVRNPLAVLSSIIKNWTGKNWFRLSEYKTDLIDAIRLLSELIKSDKPNLHIVKIRTPS